MRLHFRAFGNGDPLIILHGVFGSGDNWQTVAKDLALRNKVYLVDLRNHGQSPHSDQFDYDHMVEDLIILMRQEKINRAHFMGHSMGGKVAMSLAARYPDKVDKLIVVDISPREYPLHHGVIFDGFRSLDLPNITSRREAEEQLANVIKDEDTRLFILKNLTRDKEGKFVWKLNVDAIEANADKIGAPLQEEDWFNGHVLFIAGGRSKYITEADHPLIRKHFPNAIVKTVPMAGHWVHAEQPRALLKLVEGFLYE
jgi:esterase